MSAVIKAEEKSMLSVFIIFKGKVKHFHWAWNDQKVLIHEFKEGDVIGDPLYHQNIFSTSELVAEDKS